MLVPLPPVESLYVIDRYSDVQIEIYDNSANPINAPYHDPVSPYTPQQNQTYGAAIPVSSSGLTTESRMAILEVTFDAPGGSVDLTSIDGTILFPYSLDALPAQTSLQDYPKYKQRSMALRLQGFTLNAITAANPKSRPRRARFRPE